uniref:Uncharacterized protein n=1 Tax=Trypanosoma congolense (strain IL3000) TaxID=1068625 RepID=G0ULC1_TRYCI|nr:hypothetical protein, unlikely [Trypanosoma congolense IL3000]
MLVHILPLFSFLYLVFFLYLSIFVIHFPVFTTTIFPSRHPGMSSPIKPLHKAYGGLLFTYYFPFIKCFFQLLFLKVFNISNCLGTKSMHEWHNEEEEEEKKR